MKNRATSGAVGQRRGGSAPGRAKTEAKERSFDPPIGYDTLALRHELEVHQRELEAQNDELRAARDEAGTARDRYTALFEFAPIAYVIAVRDETIVESNRAAARLFGVPGASLHGTSLAGLTYPADRLALSAMLSCVLDGQTVGSAARDTCEVALLRTTGRFPARLTASALGRGSSRVALIAFEDASERHAADALRKETENALRVGSARKDEFLAMLAHELRNPLAPMRSGLFVLQRTDPGSRAARNAQAVLERQFAHLTRLIDDLLDVSRIVRGKVVLRRNPVDWADLVRKTLDDHRASFEASGVRLLGAPARGPLWVDADAVRLVQMMSNLLGNAEKFTPRGGEVTISLKAAAGGIVLRVRDTGAGMARDDLPYLFEPFAQAPQTVDRSRGGLGLGLAMSKGLVELHGGTIGIASEGRGRGTEVTVTLPRTDAPTATKAEERTAGIERRRILIIEDNVDAAEMLKDALEVIGHDVRIAHDGTAGLEAASELQPEVVICDIGLPGIDGYEVARAFRRERRFDRTFLVALSGYTGGADVERSRRAGFDRHLGKPADLDHLERVLDDADRLRDPSAAARVTNRLS